MCARAPALAPAAARDGTSGGLAMGACASLGLCGAQRLPQTGRPHTPGHPRSHALALERPTSRVAAAGALLGRCQGTPARVKHQAPRPRELNKAGDASTLQLASTRALPLIKICRRLRSGARGCKWCMAMEFGNRVAWLSMAEHTLCWLVEGSYTEITCDCGHDPFLDCQNSSVPEEPVFKKTKYTTCVRLGKLSVLG